MLITDTGAATGGQLAGMLLGCLALLPVSRGRAGCDPGFKHGQHNRPAAFKAAGWSLCVESADVKGWKHASATHTCSQRGQSNPPFQ